MRIDHLPKASGVYMITTTHNGKRYVGCSANILERAYRHRHAFRTGTHENRHMMRTWAKRGEAVFTVEVLELVPEESMHARECHWIDLLETTEPVMGYNMTSGGHCGFTVTEEVRAVISEKVRKANEDPEHRAARGRAISAGQATEESRLKRREAAKKVYAERPEVREKIARSVKQTMSTEEWKHAQSLRMAEISARPEVKANRSAAAKKRKATPEARAKMSQAIKAMWAKRREADYADE